MRMLQIPDLLYEDYRDIADAILSTIPFVVINLEYSKKLKTGFFYFWDMLYVPESLRQFAVIPPKTHENVALLHEKIEHVFKMKAEREKARKELMID